MNISRFGWPVVTLGALGLVAALVGPERWQALAEARYFLLSAMLNTFYYSLAGASIGLVGGSLLAAARLYGGVLGAAAAAIVTAIQALPALLIILGCYFTLPELVGLTIAPEAAAIIALGVISSTYYCEAVRGAISAVDPLQWDVAVTTGLSRTSAVVRVILPQALPAAVNSIGTASIVVYKLSTLLYPLGIQDFFRASVLVNNHVIDPFLIYGLVTVFYYATCKALTMTVARLSAGYISKTAGRVGPPAPLTGV